MHYQNAKNVQKCTITPVVEIMEPHLFFRGILVVIAKNIFLAVYPNIKLWIKIESVRIVEKQKQRTIKRIAVKIQI